MMALKNRGSIAQLVTLAVLTAVGVTALSPVLAYGHARRVILDAGTVIPVKLNEKISSDSAQKGDTFTATVPNKGSDSMAYLALPPGTRIDGHVREARAKEGKNPGMLDLAFDRAITPDGHEYSINGSLIGLDNKSVQPDSNGHLVAKKAHRTDRLTYVGYGAGAGLVLGVLGDRKNIVRDTALGAALGYLGGALEKHKSDVRDVTLKEGTKIGVRLDRRFSYYSNR